MSCNLVFSVTVGFLVRRGLSVLPRPERLLFKPRRALRHCTVSQRLPAGRGWAPRQIGESTQNRHQGQQPIGAQASTGPTARQHEATPIPSAERLGAVGFAAPWRMPTEYWACRRADRQICDGSALVARHPGDRAKTPLPGARDQVGRNAGPPLPPVAPARFECTGEALNAGPPASAGWRSCPRN